MAALPSTYVDWMVFKLRGQIEQWRVQSFNNFVAFSMNVCRPTHTEHRPLEQKERVHPGSTILELDMWNTAARTIRVKIDSDQAIQIICSGSWIPLPDWLDRLKVEISHDAEDGQGFEHQNSHSRSTQQQEWWARTGQVFPFRRLPLELRELVYEIVIPDTIHPYLRSRNRQSFFDGTPTWSLYPFMRLITASKQIYLESSRVLYNRLFLVEKYHTLKMLLDGKEQRNRLKRLQISLSHWELSKTFRSHPAYGDHSGRLPPGSIRHLQTMALQQITVVFAPPSTCTGSKMFDGACQVDVVDFLFACMWPWVRGQHVRVAGSAKDSQRQEFEETCAAEAQLVAEWRQGVVVMADYVPSIKEYYDWQEWLAEEQDGGVRLDGDKTVPHLKKPCMYSVDSDDDISDLSSDEDDDRSAFPCSCVPRCALETWTNKDVE